MVAWLPVMSGGIGADPVSRRVRIAAILAVILMVWANVKPTLDEHCYAYRMLGFAPGCIYYLLNILNPDAFAANDLRLAGPRSPDLTYVSFVTLATLGYADISPVAKAARALPEREAMTGMLYIVVFMARLVSPHSPESGGAE